MSSRRRSRVLVVEDEALVAMLIEDMLIDLGYDVIGPAANCAQALAILEKQGPPDAAILDVNLGGESVYPVAEALKERNVPFLFSTGYGDSAILDRFQQIEKLSKPFEPRRLQSALVKHCGF